MTSETMLSASPPPPLGPDLSELRSLSEKRIAAREAYHAGTGSWGELAGLAVMFTGACEEYVTKTLSTPPVPQPGLDREAVARIIESHPLFSVERGSIRAGALAIADDILALGRSTQAVGDGKSAEEQLAYIESMLSEGQGDDEGAQILPDFDERTTTVAKVAACLDLLERRRDAIEGFMAAKPAPTTDAGKDGVRKALEAVAKAASAMPRKTPAPGGASTVHEFKIDAGTVWELDRALTNLAKATSSHEAGVPGGWQPIETAPKDGTFVLVEFDSGVGVREVAWLENAGGLEIWCVDDNKHGPYALRGYQNALRWCPIPTPPASGEVA